MNLLEAIAIVLAGLAAGTVNTIVGSGSLITFPTLLLFGYPPLVANVTNNIGMVPGAISGAIGYRRELVGQRARAIPTSAAAVAGGLTGAGLLLILPASAFARIVPILILFACLVVAFQPRLARAVAARRSRGGSIRGDGRLLLVPVYLTAVYGGYFGAAQGVIMIATLAVLVADDLQRLNGLKNVLGAVTNASAAVLFIAVAPVAWEAAFLLAIGAVVGGQLGASVGRRLRPGILRGLIIVIGTTVAVKMLLP